MIVTGWNNGSPNNKTGTGYGIRINLRDQERYFKKSWSSITIELENAGSVDIRSSDSFWRKCSELRNAKIGKWMIDNKLAPWPKGSPPNLKLEPISERKFRLNLVSFKARKRTFRIPGCPTRSTHKVGGYPLRVRG